MNPALQQNLQRLWLLRNIGIAGQSAVLLISYFGLGIDIPLLESFIVVGCYAAMNVWAWSRIKKTVPVEDYEIFAQLCVDVLALTILLYLNGGAMNPFVSLYLLPLTIAATAIKQIYTWMLAAITILCYTLLMVFFMPLPQPDFGFNLHIMGMWFNFILSAILVAYFLSRIANTLRERDAVIAAAREKNLHNERIIALGIFAAGAAHELGTPLSTMAVVAKDLEREHQDKPALVKSLILLRDQIKQCKEIINRLLTSAEHPRVEGCNKVRVDLYISEVINKWQLMRPQANCDYRFTGENPAPEIVSEQMLSQAIINLLNNAADAARDIIEVEGTWDKKELAIEIRDCGNNQIAQNAGIPFFTTKEEGLGLGLFLSNETITRFGGKLNLFKRDGMTCTRIILPLAMA